MDTIGILAARLGFTPNEENLVLAALTHSSYVYDHPHASDNERLEFLGDAVLSLACGQYLYDRFPSMPEGNLSRWRAHLVCEATLAAVARRFRLGDYVRLGRSAAGSKGATRPRILAGCVEALLGAAFLAGGLARAEMLFATLYDAVLDNLDENSLAADAKTSLQEYAPDAVTYAPLGQSGPAHDPLYRVAVMVHGRQVAIGEGKSKKRAEQMAAGLALTRLRQEQ